jgi:hypothetical protein
MTIVKVVTSATKYQFRHEQRFLFKTSTEKAADNEDSSSNAKAQDSSRSQWTFLRDILLPSAALSSDMCIQTVGNQIQKRVCVAYEVSSVVSIFQLCIDFAVVARALQGGEEAAPTEDVIMKLEKISTDFQSSYGSAQPGISRLFQYSILYM